MLANLICNQTWLQKAPYKFVFWAGRLMFIFIFKHFQSSNWIGRLADAKLRTEIVTMLGLFPANLVTKMVTGTMLTQFVTLCVGWKMLRTVVSRAAGRLTAPARRPAPSTFAAAAISRPFSSEELVPGVGKGKTSTGLVSALNFGPGFLYFSDGWAGEVTFVQKDRSPFLTSRPSSLLICMHM